MHPPSNQSHPDTQARRKMLSDFADRCAQRQPAAWAAEPPSSDQDGAPPQNNQDKRPQ